MKVLYIAHRFIKSAPVYVFIPLITLMTYGILIPFSFIPIFFGPPAQPYEDRSIIYMIILACLVAPIIETAIFQALVIKVVRSFTVMGSLWAVVISGLLFGLAHSFGITSVISSGLVGMVLAYSYLVCVEKRYPAFLVVSVIHSLRNLISLVLSNL